MDRFQPINTSRLTIRNFREADLAAFAAYRNESDIARYQSWSSYTLDEAYALHAEMEGKSFGLPGEWYQFALASKPHDVILGDLALHVIDYVHAEIGFTLAPAAQGKGYARESVTALLDFVFGDFGREHISALTDARNVPSIRLLEAVGFRLAGERHAVFKREPVVELDFEHTASRWRVNSVE